MRAGAIPIGLVLALLACTRPDPAPADAPNLLLITLDTTRADYITGLGGAPGITPNLEALIARSAAFENAWSETNVTNPSHVTIMSGVRAVEHGVVNNQVPIPEKLETLPKLLNRSGWETAAFTAVRHLNRTPEWQGFDELPEVDSQIEAPEITDRAIRWLGRRRDRPFFLWVHYFDAHMLYEPPEELASVFYAGDREQGSGPPLRLSPEFQSGSQGNGLDEWLGDTRDPGWALAMYAAELHSIDAEIGRLLAELPEVARGRDTVVVVTADHGESLGEHGIFYAHKGLYEEQLRVPLLIHVPGMSPRRSSLPVSALDVFPTVTDLLGLGVREGLAGLSLTPILRGVGSERLAKRTSFLHQHAHNKAVAVRQGDWKLIWYMKPVPPVSPGPQLFNLKNDPNELRDLAAAEPDRVAAMKDAIEPYLALGAVKGDALVEIDEESRKQLEALGYLAP